MNFIARYGNHDGSIINLPHFVKPGDELLPKLVYPVARIPEGGSLGDYLVLTGGEEGKGKLQVDPELSDSVEFYLLMMDPEVYRWWKERGTYIWRHSWFYSFGYGTRDGDKIMGGGEPILYVDPDVDPHDIAQAIIGAARGSGIFANDFFQYFKMPQSGYDSIEYQGHVIKVYRDGTGKIEFVLDTGTRIAVSFLPGSDVIDIIEASGSESSADMAIAMAMMFAGPLSEGRKLVVHFRKLGIVLEVAGELRQRLKNISPAEFRWIRNKVKELLQNGGSIDDAIKLFNKLVEKHHQLPSQFAAQFKRAGLEVDDYLIDMSQWRHRLKPGGLHTGKGVENWNGAWADFFSKNPNATKDQILEFLAELRRRFKLD